MVWFERLESVKGMFHYRPFHRRVVPDTCTDQTLIAETGTGCMALYSGIRYNAVTPASMKHAQRVALESDVIFGGQCRVVAIVTVTTFRSARSPFPLEFSSDSCITNVRTVRFSRVH